MSLRPTLVLLYAPDHAAHPGVLSVAIPEGAPVVIGRSAEANMTIPDVRTSRRHAELRFEDGRVVVTNLSQNGTSIDGGHFDSAEVMDGDVIRVGDSFVILRYESDPAEPDADAPEINGISPAMRTARRVVLEAASGVGAVRIGGPPGVGKRAVAHVIHQRSAGPGELVAVDAEAGEDLEEALAAHAEAGTIYLANVSELTDESRRAIARAGAGGGPRIVVGTRLAFEASDLFAYEISLPPLRNRREDILPYVLRTLERPMVELDPELVAGLLRHLWPYNVRELSKVARALAERGAAEKKLSLDLIRDGLAFIGGSADETLPATGIRMSDE